MLPSITPFYFGLIVEVFSKKKEKKSTHLRQRVKTFIPFSRQVRDFYLFFILFLFYFIRVQPRGYN